jgi:hypothetical protein
MLRTTESGARASSLAGVVAAVAGSALMRFADPTDIVARLALH